MNNILITGGSGFIGSHFHEVWNHERIINLDLVPPAFNCQSVYCKGDVRKMDSVDQALGRYPCDIILSLAAEHEDFGVSDAAFFTTNVTGTKNLCQAATKHGIKKFIYYSSVAVYGNNKIPSTEEMTPNPIDAYGKSKLAAEQVLHQWAAEDPSRQVLIIRPVVVYGERNTANMYRLIHQLHSGIYFNLGKGDNVKSMAYVKNMVDATLFLMKDMKPGVEIYNYADEPQLKSVEIVAAICNTLGRKQPVTLPFFLLDILGWPVDFFIKLTGIDLPVSSKRIKKLYTRTYHKAGKIFNEGFQPLYNNLEGINRMVRWYKSSLKAIKNDKKQESLPLETTSPGKEENTKKDSQCQEFYVSSTG